MGSSVILNYSDEIIENVREVLWNCKERGGLFGGKFAVAEAKRLQGSWGVDVVNVASLIVLGAQIFPEQGKASDAQLNILVEKARRHDPVLISEIARLRAEKGKVMAKKDETIVPQSVFSDEENAEDFKRLAESLVKSGTITRETLNDVKDSLRPIAEVELKKQGK